MAVNPHSNPSHNAYVKLASHWIRMFSFCGILRGSIRFPVNRRSKHNKMKLKTIDIYVKCKQVLTSDGPMSSYYFSTSSRSILLGVYNNLCKIEQ